MLLSLAVSGWCGPPFLCPSWGWARLCDTGRDRGEGTAVTGWCGPSCHVTGRWLGADRWSTAACWRSRWPAGCTSELWRALCCSRGNNSSLEDGKKRRRVESFTSAKTGDGLLTCICVTAFTSKYETKSADYAIVPLSFPPVKAPLKVPPPAASPSGISSRFIRALGRGCRYTLNTWPPSLSSPGLVSTNTSSNRNTCSRWQRQVIRRNVQTADTVSNAEEQIFEHFNLNSQHLLPFLNDSSLFIWISVKTNKQHLPGPYCSWVLRGSTGSGTAGSLALSGPLRGRKGRACRTDTLLPPSSYSPPPRCSGSTPTEHNQDFLTCHQHRVLSLLLPSCRATILGWSQKSLTMNI